MTQDREREQTRIVRSWLQDGSTALPDRVLDAVLSELPLTPQQRPVRSLWRFDHMKPIVGIVGIAAIIVMAVALGTTFIAPGLVGAPGNTIGGEITFPVGSDTETVTVSGTANGSSLSGTAEIGTGADRIIVQLECSGKLDPTTWSLAGKVERAPADSVPVGAYAAVIVRDGDPQQGGLWVDDDPGAPDCATFVGSIPADVMGSFGWVTQGEIVLPKGD